MTYEQALQFWFGRVNFEVKSPLPSDLHLGRMRVLLELLGQPQERYRILHIAGSKGKGSTSAMLASVLRQAGYRTGLFTSPHLVRVEERIQVDRDPITRAELTRLMEEIHKACQIQHCPGKDPAGIHPLAETLTFFEIATALGFLHFARRRVDLAVVEVGLGGRFDSTNVCRPLLAVITSISYDHTQQLGNTLEKIALEKAGIVKLGRPTLSGVRNPGARAMIEAVCRQRGSPLRQVEVDYHYRHEPACFGRKENRPSRVEVTTRRGGWPSMEIGLIGEHQAGNAALAVAAIETLRELGLPIPDRAVAAGLAQVRWPARLEIVGRRPLVLLDCAHNVASALALVQTLEASFPPLSDQAKRFLIFAGSRDKDLAGMLAVLAPRFDRLFLTRFANSPRCVGPEQLVGLLPPGSKHSPCPNAVEAWNQARGLAKADDLICVTGSVFLAGELRPVLVK